MRTRAVVVLVGCLSLLSCKKDPSPAAVALGGFLEEIAKGHHNSVGDRLASGSTLKQRITGELEEGTVEVYPFMSVGVLDWSKTKLVKEAKLPSGEQRVEMLLDVCMRAEDQGACTRPNTYAFTALMTNEEGSWRVASASCSESNIIR